MLHGVSELCTVLHVHVFKSLVGLVQIRLFAVGIHFDRSSITLLSN